MLCSLSNIDNVEYLAKCIVATFMKLPENEPSEESAISADRVHLYFHLYFLEVTTLGLIWHGFHDATKGGDGEQVLCYWKFLLTFSKTTNHLNYANGAVHLLLKHQYLLPRRQAAQIQLSRFSNANGQADCNMPWDLYMEQEN